MKESTTFRNNYAVIEIVGGLFLLTVAIIAFAIISPYFIPNDKDYNTDVELMAYVNSEGKIVLQHIGGHTLSSYQIVSYDPVLDATYYSKITNDNWDIGEERYPYQQFGLDDFRLSNASEYVYISVNTIFEDGSLEEIFDGIIYGNPDTRNPIIYPYSGIICLISTLRTNTSDEDLICFNNTIDPNITASTYIYRWFLDGVPYYETYLPFDTENSTYTKDYSGNGYHNTIENCIWNESGVVGGTYFFDGSSSLITGDLPSVFDNIANNDFTVSCWLKSIDITEDWKIVLEARYDTKNFVRIFQAGNEIHFSVTSEGTKYVVRTDNLTSNVWYYITGTWNANTKNPFIYVNGNRYEEIGNRNYPFGAHNLFNLGHGTAGSGGFWHGFIDEFITINYVLSEKQICQFYLSTKDGNSDKSVIVAEETSFGDIWQCAIIPNDSIQDYDIIMSNPLQIINYVGGV